MLEHVDRTAGMKEMIQGYMEGDLSPAQAQRLLSLIREDNGIVDGILGNLRMDNMLRDVAGEFPVSQAPGIRKAIPARGSGRRQNVRFWIPLAAAAGITAILAAWLMVNGSWLMGGKIGEVVARVEAASGQWTLLRQGYGGQAVDSGQYERKRAPKVGDEIREGDWITVGEGGRVRLAYVGEGTWVELTSNAECRILRRSSSYGGQVRNAELLELRNGTLTAEVEKRSAFVGPFVVETPHAKVEVLGTRFTLRVQGSEQSQIANLPAGATLQALQAGHKSQIPSTWLHVDLGLVRFTRLADSSFAKATEDKGKSIEVAAGEFAVAGEEGEDYALKAYVNGTEWVEGSIIFQDDFEGDLGKWKVLSCSSALDGFEPAGAAERRRVQTGDVKGGPRTRAVAIDARNAGGVMIGIHPKIPAMPAAHVIEYDLRMQTLDAREITTVPGVTKRKSLHSVYFKAKDGWYRRRLEFMPVSGVEGQTVYDVKSYIGESLVSHELIEFSNDPLILSAGAGGILIDNVVIRKLVRVNKLGSEK